MITEVPSFSEMAREVPLINTVDKQALDNEWHLFKEEMKGFLHETDKFFKCIVQITDETGAPKYRCLGKFVFYYFQGRS